MFRLVNVVAVLGLLSCFAPAQDRRPNFLVILADDLGPEWLGAYGGENAPTPRLDALAAEGLAYRSAWSMPKCTPTRVTLLTGRYPYHHGWVNHWDVPRWNGGLDSSRFAPRSLATAFRSAGYRTAIAGKWQLDDFRVRPRALEQHGFEEWCMWTGGERGNPPSDRRYDDPYIHQGDESGTRAGAFGPDVFTDFLIDFARRHRDEPLLLYYPMVLPHGPLVATPSDPDADGKLPKFRSMVAHVDHCVGRLVDVLDELGLADDTWVVFSGDNGTSRGIDNRMAGREVRGGKGLLAESGVHTPLIVRRPGSAPANAFTGAVWDTTDLYPTLLGLAQLEAPAGTRLDGVDHSAVWRGDLTVRPRDIALALGGGVARRTPRGVEPERVWADRVVRDERHKLWVRDRAPWHLYDLQDDPGEERDLLAAGVDDPQLAAVRDRLLARALDTPLRDARPLMALDGDPGDSPRPLQRPNVILLMADDLGYGDTGLQGHPLVHTPELDRMAGDGLRFTRFHSAAPVCSPTRASCLTGQHPYRHGIRGANQGHLAADAVTLQGLLKAQGYRTGHFGKWHLGTLSETVKESNRGGPRGVEHFAPPWQRGFDVCFSTEAKVPTHDPMVHPETGEAYGTHYWNERGEMVEDNLDGDDSRVIMDRVLPFVRGCADARQPFLAVVWFHTPHLPVEASAADRAHYAAQSDLEQRYFGCITAMDRQVGRLRAALDEFDIADDTVLWFCSDNGPERNTPGTTGGLRERKRSLHEGGTRVPAFLVWPRELPGGVVVESPAVTSDFLPTLASWCGFDLPSGYVLDGTDLNATLDAAIAGAPAYARPPIGFETPGMVAWTTERWKLVGRGDRRSGDPFVVDRWELYDLVEDPAESVDRAADHPEIVTALRTALERWRRELR